MEQRLNIARLDGTRTTLVLAWAGDAVPGIAYWGAQLPGGEDLASLAAVAQLGRHESQPDIAPLPCLFPQTGQGCHGAPALALRDGNRAIVTAFRTRLVEHVSGELILHLEDLANDLAVTLRLRMASEDILRANCSLINAGSRPVAVDWLSSLALQLPAWAVSLTRFSGRWAGEMRERVTAIDAGGFAQESRGGRPGFGGGNWIVAGEVLASAGQGRLMGAHLAWSGDYSARLDRDADGAAMLLLGARLEPGEIVLAAGETYQAPDAVAAVSSGGRNGLRQAFHDHLRADVLPDRSDWGPRKVHLNSWEALAFDLDDVKAMALASAAAALGVERFVLDDGWFAGRRDDRSSLGDWSPDRDRFPAGLTPLIDHVGSLGMDFGLWVEPEMVNPDSDLYRAHPDWCLHIPGRHRPTQRIQLVLDLTRAEVSAHVFETLDRLLSHHAIAYLKWDHNRDLFPAANASGPVGHRQTLALYDLLDGLRAAHPAVEIETCASGGGRIDFAMLRRTNRVWASDNNDPIERLRINAAWSRFLPREILGSHVGPSPNPITGRRISMDFRAKVALFGHMGVEADPAAMTEGERAVLTAHIALYKQWRDVLHQGVEHELSLGSDTLFGSFCVSSNGNRGLALVAQTSFAPDYHARRVTLPGLEPERYFRVFLPEPWPRRSARYLANVDQWQEGFRMSGRALGEVGLALPLAHPETAWLIAVEQV